MSYVKWYKDLDEKSESEYLLLFCDGWYEAYYYDAERLASKFQLELFEERVFRGKPVLKVRFYEDRIDEILHVIRIVDNQTVDISIKEDYLTWADPEPLLCKCQLCDKRVVADRFQGFPCVTGGRICGKCEDRAAKGRREVKPRKSPEEIRHNRNWKQFLQGDKYPEIKFTRTYPDGCVETRV